MLKPTVYKCEVLLSRNGRTWPCIVFTCELSAWLNPLFTNSVEITQVMNMEINECGSPMWFWYNFWLLLRYFSSRNACEQTRLMIVYFYRCGASEPEASERSSSLICAERGFWTKFYLAHGIVVVRDFYTQNTHFKLARVFEFLSNF
jgi:hypothetical protein